MSTWGHIICFVIVLAGCMVGAYRQSDGFDLELIDIVPCQEVESDRHQIWNVSLHESDILAVEADLTSCHGSSWNINQYNGFRLRATRSQADNFSYPVVFVARQSTHGTLSFSIPFQPSGFSMAFFDVSRTVCPIIYQNRSTDVNNLPRPPLFYIDVFTSSPQLQNYSISIEPVENFTLQLDETYSTVITPSSPQIFYFKMPAGIREVTIEATTDSKMCAIVSVQNVTCPVNDLLENARSIGIFQTMSTSAFLTVDVSQVNDHEFLVVLIATSYSICHSKDVESANAIHSATFKDDLVVNSSLYQQELSITIKQLKPISDYLFAILLPMFVVFPLFSLVIVFLLFDCFPKARCEPLYKRPCCCLIIKCVCPVHFLCWCSGDQHVCTCPPCMQEEEGEAETLTGDEEGMGNYQSVHKESQEAMNYELGSKIDAEIGEEDKINLRDQQHIEIEESNLRLSRMNTRKYEHLEDQYCLYGWNTVTVGIFYALPALQLVLSEQKLLNLSGDQDECYYNFKCAHPLSFPFFSVQFHFNTFNNVWSNIGYVLLGFLFIVLVLIRRHMYRKQRRLDKLYTDSHGVPQFFGIYFAMGFALILEGFMSSFYHICPNDSNFQFDTAFMFIIGGLLLVKIFQNRHPDIHANAFIAFFSFAVIIFCTLFGIYFGRKNPVPVRLLIFVLALLLLLIFLVSFYYFHNWRWSKAVVMKAVMNIKDFFTCKSGPSHRIRFVKLITAFCINLVLAILVVALYSHINIAMAVLAFFLLNLLFFLAVYVLFKLWFREPLTWLALLLPFLIAVVWAAAFYFFKVVPVTEWKLTPAESRELNKECTLLGFYDNHDIWHFLSAIGMFFAFLFLLVLDDGVADVKRESLHIF